MSALKRSFISLLILGVGVGGFLWMGTPKVETRPARPPKPPLVQLVSAEEHTQGIEFEVDGVVVPYREVDLAAQVSGRISYKSESCRVGRAVETGELLLKIDSQDYEIEVKRLEESLAQAEAMLDELDAEMSTTENQIKTASAQLDIATRQLKRSVDLESRGMTSNTEVEEARIAELNARNALQILRDQKNLLSRRRVRMESAVKLEAANLERARLDLARTEIRSPLDGVVVSESVEKDGYIQAGNTLIRLQDTSRLDVTCKLHMQQMNWIWQSGNADSEAAERKDTTFQKGAPQTGTANKDLQETTAGAYEFPRTPAKVIFKLGNTSYEWQGTVDRYDGAGIDNQTRMIPCRVHVDDPLDVEVKESGRSTYTDTNPPTLMTGMFVKVLIKTDPPIPLVSLPQSAIQPGDKVWTVEDGRLHRKELQIATSNDDQVIAYQDVNGLQAGDAVVVSPIATPVEGLPVIDANNEPIQAKSF